MSARLVRMTLWTDLACNTPTFVAVVLPLVSCQTTEEIVNLLVTRRAVFAVPMDWEDADQLTLGRVVRLEFDTTGTLWDEYRISDVVDSLGQEGLLTVTAMGIEHDLAAKNLLVYETVNGVVGFAPTGAAKTPSTQLTDYVDAALPSYWAVGTVTPTAAIDVLYNQDSPLSAALKIAAAAKQATDIQYEFSVRRNGTTGYLLDLTVYGATAATPTLLVGKNLNGVRRTAQSAEQFTRVFPIGADGLSIGGAKWNVTAVSLNVSIDIAPIDGSSINPILADDQFNTGFSWVHEDGVEHDITDTDRANKRLFMASTTGIAVGEWGGIMLTGALEVPYLDHPTAQTTYGIRIGKILLPGFSHTNWAKNPDFSDWPGTDPVGYTRAGTAASKITTAGLWLRGGQSARLNVNSSSLQTTSRSINLLAGQTITYTMWVRIAAFSSASQSSIRFRDPQAGTDSDYFLDGTVSDLAQLNTWLTFTRSFSITSTGVKTIQAGILTQTGSVDVYWDSVQISVTTGAVAFVDGSGAAINWLKGAQALGTHSEPIVSYDVDVLDLFRLDPAAAGQYEELSLGAQATIVAAALGITVGEAQRMVRVLSNQLVPHDTRLTLASALPEFTRLLAA